MKRWRTYLFAGCCAVVLGACTGNFRDLNDDKSGITDKELEADDNGLGYRLGIVQQGVYFNYDYGKGKNWPFQMIQNLNADMFSGYMHDPKPLQGGSHNSDYNLQGWAGTAPCGSSPTPTSCRKSTGWSRPRRSRSPRSTPLRRFSRCSSCTV